jgi:hypothetical protein
MKFTPVIFGPDLPPHPGKIAVGGGNGIESGKDGRIVRKTPEELLLEEFAEAYKTATGSEYNFDYPGEVTVTKSTLIVHEWEPIVETIVMFGVTALITKIGTVFRVSSYVTGGASLFLDVASAAGALGAGKYPTYTVTKTKYVGYEVEIANYHGYRVYGTKFFKYTEFETYVFLNGEIAQVKRSYQDEYLAYRYRNHW